MNKKWNRGNEKVEIWDIVHLILCIIVCILTVMIFIDSKSNMFLFPFVFIGAGLMNMVTMARLFVADKAGKRNIPGGCVFLLFAVGLFAVAFIGAKVCW